MTSNLTVCYMAAKANEPHVERAAIRASLIEEAVASRRHSERMHRPAAMLVRPSAISRLVTSVVGMRGAAFSQAERA